jgi:hypothetical protein
MHRQHYTPARASKRGQALAIVAALALMAATLAGMLAYFDVLTK